jgi:hypothetical protein
MARYAAPFRLVRPVASESTLIERCAAADRAHSRLGVIVKVRLGRLEVARDDAAPVQSADGMHLFLRFAECMNAA